MPHNSDDDSEYTDGKNVGSSRARRRRRGMKDHHKEKDNCFEEVIEPLLDDLLSARKQCEETLAEIDESGSRIRPLRAYEAVSSTVHLNALRSPSLTTSQALLLRKLKVETREYVIQAPNKTLVTGLDDSDPPNTSANPDVLDALYSVETTPFSSSFVSRLHGTDHHLPPGLISVDWETRTPWMDLMVDIHDHYSLAHPDRDQPKENTGPITYSTLRAIHIPQVHDLLERSFWPGIDVRDSLGYQPEKATILAMYRKIVVGVAILKSPRETYIMYLAVKAGWDKSQIARTMLYHLIAMNPHKDITLHVSTNNSAMLLYNQFGFKVEEFVAGFYSKYLDPQSRLSNNAFKLRLRHLQN